MNMRLSRLQKYILKYGYFTKNKVVRQKLVQFYDKQKKSPKKENQVNIITKSLERLINEELMTGYGVRTPHKWFIKEIKLTAKGRRQAKKLLGQQQRLPFKKILK